MTLAAGTGFDFLDPFDLAVLFVGIAVFAAVGALSHQHERAFSASLIYLGLGAGAAVAIAALDIDWIDPIADAELIEHLAEAALVMALFSAGLKLDRPLTLRNWSTVTRLLLLAMPLTIGAAALLGDALLGLSGAAALLLGAALAPTDPVLAGDIGVGPPGDEDEHEPNFALTAEAGLNDGLAAPFVLAGLFAAQEGGSDWALEWLAADVLYAIAGGVAIGAAAGTLAAWSVKRLRSRDMLAPEFDGFHAIATALVIYGIAELAGTYGFLAVFAGGLAFRRYEHDHEINATVHEGAERVEKLLELAVILLLGSMLTTTGLAVPGWEGWLLAVLLLAVVRPAACLLSLVGSHMEHDHEINATVHEGAERVEKLLELAVILLLGSMLTTTGLSVPGWEGWLLAVLLLAVVRPAACLLSLVGSHMEHPGEKAFVAWFGVRGVGTLYYVAVVVAAGALGPAEQELLVWTCVAAVLVSIVVHGITAGPSLRRLLVRQRAAPPQPTAHARR